MKVLTQNQNMITRIINSVEKFNTLVLFSVLFDFKKYHSTGGTLFVLFFIITYLFYFIYFQSICQKSAERQLSIKYFLVFRFAELNRSLKSNKPKNYGDFINNFIILAEF